MKKLLLILFIGLLGAQTLHAGDELPTPVAIIHSEGESSQVETVSEEIIIEVDPSLATQEIQTQTPRKKGVYLWALQFIRDKVKNNLGKILSKVPPELRDTIVNDVNQKLSAAPEIVEGSNGSGYSGRLLAMAGAGATDYFRKKLAEKRWGRYLVKVPNFGVALGGGLAFVTYEREGRRKLIFRLFADYERLDKVVNWMGEAIAGGSVGKISEKISVQLEEAERMVVFEKLTFKRSSLGPAANMIIDDRYFEHTANITAGGGLGLSSFYELKVKQLRVSFLFDIQRIVDVKRSLAKSCRWAIGRGRN